MKLVNKRIYCNNCRRLVTGIEQKANHSVRISCSRCNKSLWEWNGTYWKSIRAEV